MVALDVDGALAVNRVGEFTDLDVVPVLTKNVAYWDAFVGGLDVVSRAIEASVKRPEVEGNWDSLKKLVKEKMRFLDLTCPFSQQNTLIYESKMQQSLIRSKIIISCPGKSFLVTYIDLLVVPWLENVLTTREMVFCWLKVSFKIIETSLKLCAGGGWPIELIFGREMSNSFPSFDWFGVLHLFRRLGWKSASLRR